MTTNSGGVGGAASVFSALAKTKIWEKSAIRDSPKKTQCLYVWAFSQPAIDDDDRHFSKLLVQLLAIRLVSQGAKAKDARVRC